MSEKAKVRFTTILKKYPTYRDDVVNGCWKWLQGRRVDDNAEGLWRVHDKLYDLKHFMKIHPGGREWIALTEGVDVTEAFESYHITDKASQVLKGYYVRDAAKPRNYNFTYANDGFYRTLKRRAAEKMATLDKSKLWQSKIILDLDVAVMFMAAIFTVRVESLTLKFIFGFIAAQCFGWLNTISHNFIHQRNNWRMYTACLVFTGWRNWRVYHGFSHHLYPNSYADIEISGNEPLVSWMPTQPKTKLNVAVYYLLTPVMYGLLFYLIFGSRLLGYIYNGFKQEVWEEFIPLLLPLSMLLLGNPTFTFYNIAYIFVLWTAIVITGCTLFSIVAFNAGHHGQEIVHEGDEFKGLDFGIYQLSAIIDRPQAASNHFMTLTHFGDHILHHMFPSLDHSLLPQFRDILLQTCSDFDEELREFSFLDGIVEQFKQLKRTETIKLQD